MGFRKDTTYNSCWIISIVGVTSYHPTSAAPLQVFGRDSQNRFRKYLPGLVNIQKAIEHVEIVSFPMKNGDFPEFFVNVYQRVKPLDFL